MLETKTRRFPWSGDSLMRSHPAQSKSRSASDSMTSMKIRPVLPLFDRLTGGVGLATMVLLFLQFLVNLSVVGAFLQLTTFLSIERHLSAGDFPYVLTVSLLSSRLLQI